eukprot:gb/GFBE01012261.1/.p1 GENE.gb/GFBE01012261.1/~~gb/GFBE01012261.1/.p1  ORF type:complete len:441 (+),score=77.48 gb/GFBE01012261.1/:1-1323(+)
MEEQNLDTSPASGDVAVTNQENSNAPRTPVKRGESRIEQFGNFMDSWFSFDRHNGPSASKPTMSKASLQPKSTASLQSTAGCGAGKGIGRQTEASGGILDIDGDGDVDLEDIMAAMDADVEGEQQDTVEHMQQHYPIYILLQVIVCVILWIVGSSITTAEEGGGFDTFLIGMGGLETFVPGNSMLLIHKDCEDLRTQVWRFISYQYTHGSMTHIAMNTLLTLIAGIPLEGYHGHLRTLIIFNVSVVGGGLFHVISRGHDKGLIGMSAGCYSLMAMHMADLIMNWKQNRWRKPKFAFLIALILVDVVTAYLAKPDDATGHSAHMGGYLAGLVFGVLLVRNTHVTRWERVCQVVMVLIGVGFVVFAGWWMSQWEPRTIWDPVPWCWARQVFSPLHFRDGEWHCARCSEESCIEKWLQITNNNPDLIHDVDYKLCTVWEPTPP